MTAESHPYSLATLRKTTGLTRHAISRLTQLGFVRPTRDGEDTLRFSFADIVALRSAQALRRAGLSTRAILATLQRLRTAMPADVSLNGLRIGVVGRRITVHTQGGVWEADTGQRVLDFDEVSGAGSSPDRIAKGIGSSSPVRNDIVDLFDGAERLEETNPALAEEAYKHLLKQQPDHAHAYLNLGFILCGAERFTEAVALYDRAVAYCRDDPLVHYNRGVALGEMKRAREAAASYEDCLALAPDLADAHQNLALLYAELGEGQKAIRHFNDFRRLNAGR